VVPPGGPVESRAVSPAGGEVTMDAAVQQPTDAELWQPIRPMTVKNSRSAAPVLSPLVPLLGPPPYRRSGRPTRIVAGPGRSRRPRDHPTGSRRPRTAGLRRRLETFDDADPVQVRVRIHPTPPCARRKRRTAMMGVRARRHPRRDARRIYGGLPGMRTCARCRLEYQASKRCTESRGCFCSVACMESARLQHREGAEEALEPARSAAPTPVLVSR
jgi:hypothetical protein